MAGMTMDAGGLIAVERGDRRVGLLLDEAERTGLVVAVPVGPLAQAWRGGSRQARLARFLRATTGVDLVGWDDVAAMAAGVLCGRTGSSDVVDASVALCARERSHAVVTSDPDDIAALDPRLRLIVM